MVFGRVKNVYNAKGKLLPRNDATLDEMPKWQHDNELIFTGYRDGYKGFT